MLLGAAVGIGTQRLLDLGAGVGTAGLVALALGRAGSATLVERDERTIALAAGNIEQNDLTERARTLRLDILASGAIRQAAGLQDNHYDAVIANPPYFNADHGTLAADGARAGARHMNVSALDGWVRCAASSARSGGDIIFVYPAHGLASLLGAIVSRVGAISVLPLVPRPGQPASRVLVRGIKGSRAPLTLLASRALHGVEGNAFAPEFDAILRGTAALDW